MNEPGKGPTNITINGDKNHVVAGDNNGINGNVYLDKPERKVDAATLQEIIALNKNNKPFEVIYYTNTEECRKFGVAIIEALKAKGFTATFIARTAMAGINYLQTQLQMRYTKKQILNL